jgi:hypothetical protein
MASNPASPGDVERIGKPFEVDYIISIVASPRTRLSNRIQVTEAVEAIMAGWQFGAFASQVDLYLSPDPLIVQLVKEESDAGAVLGQLAVPAQADSQGAQVGTPATRRAAPGVVSLPLDSQPQAPIADNLASSVPTGEVPPRPTLDTSPKRLRKIRSDVVHLDLIEMVNRRTELPPDTDPAIRAGLDKLADLLKANNGIVPAP